jgi:aquaporin NIP
MMADAYSGGAVTHVGVSLSFAFVVLAVIYAIGHLSGAHINPAVTLAFWSARRFPGRDAAFYTAAQCGGAVAAALTLRAILGEVGQIGATIRPSGPAPPSHASGCSPSY